MIASAHLAAGAVAGMASAHFIQNRILRSAMAFSLGLLSHLAMDWLPHSDYGQLSPTVMLVVAMCETIALCAVIGYILRRRVEPRWPEYILPGVAGAGVPDAKIIAPIFLPDQATRWVEQQGDAFHSHFHTTPLSSPLWGLGVEISCTLLLLAILTMFRRKRVTRDS